MIRRKYQYPRVEYGHMPDRSAWTLRICLDVLGWVTRESARRVGHPGGPSGSARRVGHPGEAPGSLSTG